MIRGSDDVKRWDIYKVTVSFRIAAKVHGRYSTLGQLAPQTIFWYQVIAFASACAKFAIVKCLIVNQLIWYEIITMSGTDVVYECSLLHEIYPE